MCIEILFNLKNEKEMAIEKEIPDLQELKDQIPQHLSLVYVDYNDNLNDGHIDLLQDCVSENSLDKLYEKTSEWYSDSEQEGLHECLKDLKKYLQNRFNLTEDEAFELVDKYDDELRDEIYSKDTSTPVKDLLRNTSGWAVFYDTGIDIEADSWNWRLSELKSTMRMIKHKLGIPAKYKKYDDDIITMISQASYGGDLVLYFYSKVEDLILDDEESGDWESILFNGELVVAIINTGNGSGDHVHIPLGDIQIKLPFVRENLFIDLYHKYNYVNAVCGMDQDFAEGSKVSFSFLPVKGKVEISSLHNSAQIDREYARIYKEGGCTYSDADIKRHRGVYYRNDYPCGHVCPNCNRFWID